MGGAGLEKLFNNGTSLPAQKGPVVTLMAPHRQRRELLRELPSPLLPKPDLVVRVRDSGRLFLLRWHGTKRSCEEWHRPCRRAFVTLMSAKQRSLITVTTPR